MKMGSDTPLLRHTTLMTVHCRRCDLRAGRDSDQPRRIRQFLLSAIVNYFAGRLTGIRPREGAASREERERREEKRKEGKAVVKLCEEKL